MDVLENYTPDIREAVDKWLDEPEGFAIRCERMPDNSLEWLYEAAKIGASVIIEDKVDGLISDLDSAIEVAWNRGAYAWVRLNYPKHYERFTCGEVNVDGLV